MNYKELARKWLIEHEHYEHEHSFNDDLESLLTLITTAVDHYFDTYEEIAPTECKNCKCGRFK